MKQTRSDDQDKLREAMKLMEKIATLPLSRGDSKLAKAVRKAWQGKSDRRLPMVVEQTTERWVNDDLSVTCPYPFVVQPVFAYDAYAISRLIES